jgi:Polyphosphate kinase 2 (PPK2)
VRPWPPWTATRVHAGDIARDQNGYELRRCAAPIVVETAGAPTKGRRVDTQTKLLEQER